MKKTIRQLVLLLVLLCLLPVAALAANSEATQAAETLYALGLFKGTGTNSDGTPIFDLDKTPTRNQALIMLVRLLGKEQEALAGDWEIPFADVSDSMRPYVGYAYTEGLTNGTSAATYSGTNPIKANQYITFVLRALGYVSGEDFSVSSAWELSDRLGITGGTYQTASSFRRGDVALISAKALSCCRKDETQTLLASIRGQKQDSRFFADILQQISEEHRRQVESEEAFDGFTQYLVDDPSTANLLSDAEIRALVQGGSGKASVSYSQAVSDVDVLFRALKSSYGAYYYFGEDAFRAAKEQVLFWLQGRSTVKVYEMSQVIARALSFVKDAHSTIGAKYLLEKGWRYEYYYCVGHEYEKDERGYYQLSGAEKWYVQSFSDDRVRMELSLSPAGKLVYAPVLFCLTGTQKDCRLQLVSETGKAKAETLTWRLQSAYGQNSYRTPDYKLLKENGIAYLSIRCFDQAHESVLRQFVADAAKLRDCRAIIFDLRSNGGGSDRFAFDWVQSFSGQTPQITRIFSNRSSLLRNAVLLRDGMSPETMTPGTFMYVPETGKQIPNRIPILVLVDDLCGSSGETMLNSLRALENVLIIGSNSAGYQLCGNGMRLSLPNSRMEFSLGSSLQFWMTPDNVDYRGYEPDVWCDPKGALDAALNLLLHYDLTDMGTWQRLQAKL